MNFIIGRSGSGKSTYCMNQIKDEIIKACGNDKPLIYIAPEQFTFETERKLIDTIGRNGIMDVQVYSFKRLAHKIFTELGYNTSIIGDAGKNMLIYWIMIEQNKNLKVLKNVSKNIGIVDTVANQISEFKRYNITPEILKNINVQNEYLKLKLSDLYLIYSEYEKRISDNYIDLNDELTILLNLLDKPNSLCSAKIWIDEFDGFTPQEFEIVKKLESISDVTVSMIVDETSELFKLNNNIYKKLSAISNKNNVIKLDNMHRFNSSEIKHLEENIFRFPYDKYNGNVSDISISLESNSYSEIENIAIQIANYVRENNMRYENIAVLTKDIDEYEKLFRIIFSKYNIPFFIDSKRGLYSQPLMNLILSLFDICINNYSYESMFGYLKTGLANIKDINDIDLLENYVLKCGIRGNTWNQTWEFGDANLEKINMLRQQVITPIQDFKKSLGNKKTVKDTINSLYEFLISIGVYENLQAKVDTLKDINTQVSIEISNEYVQVWNILMSIFDEMAETLGNDYVSFEQFKSVFKLGIATHEIGLIPPSKDQVIIGDIERTRNNNIKVLFVIGMNDGKFPCAHSDEGFINDGERDLLLENGMEIAKNTKMLIDEENFNIYKAFAVPSDKLHLSCPISTLEGKALRKSFVLNNVKRVFPNIVELDNFLEETNDSKYISTYDSTFEHLLIEIRNQADNINMNNVWQNVYLWYKNNESDKLEKILQALKYKNVTENISIESAEKLYGTVINSSVSRLERYASCPYSYYLEYGLKAKERAIYKLETPDTGTFLHEIIDRFTKYMLDNNIDWRTIEKDKCDEVIENIVDDVLKNFKHNLLNSTSKLKQLGIKLKRLVKRMVWLIIIQIRSGEFNVSGSEVEFGKESDYPAIQIELSNGRKMFLNGKIDRIDIANIEDGKYVRIIDYKSSAKQIKLSDVYYGLQLQLVTYMDAISNEDLIPGGILYLKLDDPIIKSNKDMSKEEIEEQIMMALRMKGLVLANARLIKAMDTNMTDESTVLNLSVKRDGSYSKMPTSTEEEFERLKCHIRNVLKTLGDEISNGNIVNEPVKRKTGSPCDYCSYKSICQFDKRLGNSTKNLKELTDEEVWKKV